MLDNIDPVGALIGFTGLILAVAAFAVPSLSFRKRAMIAGGCVVVAGIGAGVLIVASLIRGTPDAEASPAGPPESASNTRPATAQASATTDPTADLSIAVQVLTTDYRRTDETNSTYRVPQGISDLEFRYGWISRTPEGDLSTSDCVVNAILKNKANGAVIENYPSNACSRTGLKPSPRLDPGRYNLAITIIRDGSTYASNKDITVLPS